jgi:hypothetical protein
VICARCITTTTLSSSRLLISGRYKINAFGVLLQNARRSGALSFISNG